MSAALTPERLVALYPALVGLPTERIAKLLRPESIMHLPAGTQVFAEHQPCQGFPLLLEGSIKVIKLAANGRELMLYRVTPGGSCIISSSCLLGHSDYNARGIAETPLTLLALPVSVFAKLMVEHAPFRDFVFHLFADRIGELMQLVEEVALRCSSLGRSILPLWAYFFRTPYDRAKEEGGVGEYHAEEEKIILGEDVVSFLRSPSSRSLPSPPFTSHRRDNG